MQKEAETRLKTSLREKELLLHEVHHRVKNNLQVICSLLNMQAIAANDPALTSALEESQKRILAMAMIHDMLYASNSLNEVDFAEYLQLLPLKYPVPTAGILSGSGSPSICSLYTWILTMPSPVV